MSSLTKHRIIPALETKNAPDIMLELKTQFGEHHDLVKKLSGRLEELESHVAEVEKIKNRPRPGRDGTTPDTAEEHKQWGKYVKTGAEEELKSISTGNDESAGYLVNTAMSTTIANRIFDESPMRRLSRVITITDGDGWEEPQETGETGGAWAGETETRVETSPSKFGILKVPLHEIFALQWVSQAQLDLSYLNLGQWIEGRIAEKFARMEALAYLQGTGVGQPQGFMTLAADATTEADADRARGKLQYVPSGNAAAVTADALISQYWALRAPYRKNGSWLMSSATAAKIDQLKSGDGQYLWRPAITADALPTLLGRPVEIDENMPAVAAGTFPIAFGDFSKGYTIVDWSGIRALRDPFSQKPFVGFYAYRRTGGGVSNTEAIKLMKIEA